MFYICINNFKYMKCKPKYRVIRKGIWYYPQERTCLLWGLIKYWESFVVYTEDANGRMYYADVKYDSLEMAELVIQHRKDKKKEEKKTVIKEYE